MKSQAPHAGNSFPSTSRSLSSVAQRGQKRARSVVDAGRGWLWGSAMRAIIGRCARRPGRPAAERGPGSAAGEADVDLDVDRVGHLERAEHGAVGLDAEVGLADG